MRGPRLVRTPSMAATMPRRAASAPRTGWAWLLGLAACLAASQAGARAPVLSKNMPAAGQDVMNCLAAAAGHHGVDPVLLHAIASVESGLNPRALNRANANGSRDIGLMQINSGWLPVLKRWGITEERLYEPCTSAYVGAWILAGNITRHGRTWRAVGAYNAVTPSRQLAYVRRVKRQLAQSGQHRLPKPALRTPRQ